jgi:membrane protein DedA with SNARE-associated domain
MLRLIDTYDDQTIFLWLMVEETGFPLPLPGDMAMLIAGYRAGQGKMNPFWALALLELATLAGGSILYWFSSRGGRPLLSRYGRFVRLDRAKLDRVERWLQGRQAPTIMLGRIIPGLRNVTVIAAGAFGVPYRIFLPAFALSSFVYIAFFFCLGMWLGPQAVAALALPRLSLRLVATLIGGVALGGFLVVMQRRAETPRRLECEPAPEARRIETGALAGFLATIEMALATNTLLYLLGGLRIYTPERTLVDFLSQAAQRAGGPGMRFPVLLTAIVLFGGLAWGIIYSHLAGLLPGRNTWLRGLIFSLLPLAISALVLMPVLGAGPLGLGLGAGLLPIAGEACRSALFGVGLADSYSLMRVARLRRRERPQHSEA